MKTLLRFPCKKCGNGTLHRTMDKDYGWCIFCGDVFIGELPELERPSQMNKGPGRMKSGGVRLR